MGTTSEPSERIRHALAQHETEIAAVLRKYSATSPRVFGSVARGDADSDSDLDLLVDLAPDRGNELLRVAGIAEELSVLLGVKVDVVAPGLLRDEVSATAYADAVVM